MSLGEAQDPREQRRRNFMCLFQEDSDKRGQIEFAAPRSGVVIETYQRCPAPVNVGEAPKTIAAEEGIVEFVHRLGQPRGNAGHLKWSACSEVFDTP